MKRAGKPVRWAVYLLRRKAERLGTVDAADETAAIEKACAVFKITQQERFRISVQRE